MVGYYYPFSVCESAKMWKREINSQNVAFCGPPKSPHEVPVKTYNFTGYGIPDSKLSNEAKIYIEMSDIFVLYDGYSNMIGENQLSANCTCTFIKGTHNVIVDTMTSWDSEKLIHALDLYKTKPTEIDYVISTHGHSDHIGNNNLFLSAKHIVGFSISHQDTYYIHPFDTGKEYKINQNVKVIPTPGHTLSDVTVLVQNKQLETVAITGDLFEKFEDIEKPDIWLEAGSEDPVQQKTNRSKVADLVNWIIPGHGPLFKVTDEIRVTLRKQIEDQ